MGCHGTHRRVIGNARWETPTGGEARAASREAGDYSLRNPVGFVFSRAEHFLPQATAPARAAVWFVPPAAPLAATEHWR